MGLKSHRSEAPFGQRTLDCFEAGQDLSEFGFREIQQLKQADFRGTVELLIPGRMAKTFLNFYGAFRARQGFSPGILWRVFQLRRRPWVVAVTYGWPLGLAAASAACWAAGLAFGDSRAYGVAAIVVSVLIWLWAMLFSFDGFVREAHADPSPAMSSPGPKLFDSTKGLPQGRSPR